MMKNGEISIAARILRMVGPSARESPVTQHCNPGIACRNTYSR